MSKDSNYLHIPVLAEEAIEALKIDPEGIYIDCTAGGGGHSALILQKMSKKGRFIALDRDREAITAARLKLDRIPTTASWEIVHAEFSSLKELLQERDISAVDGVLVDLGVSSAQLDKSERGFSYHIDGPLDMRMNAESDLTALRWLEGISQEELSKVLREYGEERYASRISKAIISARDEGAIKTTGELAAIIVNNMPASSRREQQHPARRSFQAIRIAVNDELGELEKLLDILPEVMADKGRIVIITFHSLEDRMVKKRFNEWERPCICPTDLPICACHREPIGKVIKNKNDTASDSEKEKNVRSRSARLRIFERRIV
ncbi:MAG TPA: 16S rRNA (cytosine(1402)-N(4))-methyltransferase RsmH [Clostridiaceae bacterium]|nr:16S rRNA (cytosine(1402)-N(4))-methyltransferase RsmH [Clostridiaceae bacterium]